MEAGEFSAVLASLAERTEGIVDRIMSWSNVNSGSYHAEGVGRMASVLAGELETLTPDVRQFSLPEAEETRDAGTCVRREVGPAVRAVCRPEAPVQVFLSGHLDTVFPREHSFQKARREGNRLIGPGVADMKGGLAVMVEALRLLENSPERERIGWEVLLGPDEEIGSPQSGPLLVEAAARHQVGLVFEPALPDGKLVSGRLGTGNFLVRVKGRPVHAGRDFFQGRSAVVALAEMVTGFHALNREGGPIVNVGRIVGGEALNIVPAAAACRLNVRVATVEQARRTEEELRAIASGVAKRAEVEVDITGAFGRPPKPITPALELMLEEFRRCARQLGFELGWAPTGGGSDGNNLAAAGLPTVDSLGVRGGGMHTSDEFLCVDSIAERISLCFCFLQKMARGDLVLPERH